MGLQERKRAWVKGRCRVRGGWWMTLKKAIVQWKRGEERRGEERRKEERREEGTQTDMSLFD